MNLVNFYSKDISSASQNPYLYDTTSSCPPSTSGIAILLISQNRRPTLSQRSSRRFNNNNNKLLSKLLIHLPGPLYTHILFIHTCIHLCTLLSPMRLRVIENPIHCGHCSLFVKILSQSQQAATGESEKTKVTFFLLFRPSIPRTPTISCPCPPNWTSPSASSSSNGRR